MVDAAGFERLVVLMARMAGGDRAAVFTFYAEFGKPVASTMRRQLARLGVDRVERDDLDGLVIDGCMAIAGCAAGWSPDGGALPWVWAERRLAAVASTFVGQHADELDEAYSRTVAAPEPASALDIDELELLQQVAAQSSQAALLAEALELVTTPRNRAILLGFGLQVSLGDPSPAVTVAGQHGMQPANVRQVVKRTKDRLRALASTEPRFQPLADLALLA